MRAAVLLRAPAVSAPYTPGFARWRAAAAAATPADAEAEASHMKNKCAYLLKIRSINILVMWDM